MGKENGKLENRKFEIIQATVCDKFIEFHNMSFRKSFIMFAFELHREKTNLWYDQLFGKPTGQRLEKDLNTEHL